MSKGLFLLRFLGGFGLLLGAWHSLGITPLYTRPMLATAGVIGALTHGWLLEPAGATSPFPVWVSGPTRIELKVQLDSLAIGLVPLLALLIATPNVPLTRRLRQIGLGVVSSFLLNAIILACFPLLLFYQNDFTDVLGTFIGLVGFVGSPVILWFVLAFSDIRPWLPRFRAANVTAAATPRTRM